MEVASAHYGFRIRKVIFFSEILRFVLLISILLKYLNESLKEVWKKWEFNKP